MGSVCVGRSRVQLLDYVIYAGTLSIGGGGDIGRCVCIRARMHLPWQLNGSLTPIGGRGVRVKRRLSCKIGVGAVSLMENIFQET